MRGRLLPGIGAHHSARPMTDEWLTPPEILRAFAEAGHVFDLDPCASLEATPWPELAAQRSFTAEDDGLHQVWEGSVWLNPPYSEAADWLGKLADHGTGVALVFARCDTRWWFDAVWPHASGFLFVEGRLTFYHPGGERSKPGHNSGGPSVLISFGDREFEALSKVTIRGALMGPALGVRRV